MSTWQSFFNQLSKPVNNEIFAISEKICQCNTGSLEFSGKSYLHNGNCTLKSACCAIQIDKHKAKRQIGFKTNSTKSDGPLIENHANRFYSLESFLKR
ncbi:MAG: hypothetical protein ACFFAU_03905 [Candidatus Hodarchaeota archaeon]